MQTIHTLPELILLLVVLSCFTVLGTTRLSTCIRGLAAQGLLLGVLPLALASRMSVHVVVLAVGTVAVKAVILPWFLAWAIREAAVRREVQPAVGFIASLVLGALALALAFSIAAHLPALVAADPLLVPVSLTTVMIGFVVMTSRRKAITQVVGYLMLENGIYLFGLTQTESVPFLLELGVLLDVFVGVFIMGIVVFHINREFDSLDSGAPHGAYRLMRLLALWILPILAGAVAFAIPTPRVGRRRIGLLIAVAAVHLGLVTSLWIVPSAPTLGGWFAVDALGLIVLTLTSVLFLYRALRGRDIWSTRNPVADECSSPLCSGFSPRRRSSRSASISPCSGSGWKRQLSRWLPSSIHRHDRRSLEAVWKYLLISSVGIALALMGTFFLSTAQNDAPGRALIVSDLVANAHALHPAWLRTSFLFLLVGYGTKMGLAPMHTWKPDTYGEAPSLVSGLMAGALTSCAFLGIARITQVTMAAGLGPFVQPVLHRVRTSLARRRRDVHHRPRRPEATSRVLSVEHMGSAGTRSWLWRHRSLRERASCAQQRIIEGTGCFSWRATS